jgi:hypothetical protein
MKKVEKTFEIGIKNTAIYPVMIQSATEPCDSSRRFRRLPDRWMDQDHREDPSTLHKLSKTDMGEPFGKASGRTAVT